MLTAPDPLPAAFDAEQWPEHPRLVASTGDTYNAALRQFQHGHHVDSNNFFKGIHWSGDGTSLLASTADNILKFFILPPELLEQKNDIKLKPYSSHELPGSCYATALHPSFSLVDASNALYLASVSGLPIRLVSPFSTTKLASYPLVNPTTEVYIAPHSLLFDTYSTRAENNFFAGHDSEISIFDLTRPGAGPHTTLKTIPSKRKKLVGGGVGFKGIVSTIDCSNDGILAAGSFTRWIGLYDSGGRGGEVGVFKVDVGLKNGNSIQEHGGQGITQVQWTADGKYLCVAERRSNNISVWDIRDTGKRLTLFTRREANTSQRMGFDITNNKVVAGDLHGKVNIWPDIGHDEGEIPPNWQFEAHRDTTSGAAMHPFARVLATCSGQRLEVHNDDEGPPQAIDNSLKIWSLYDEKDG